MKKLAEYFVESEQAIAEKAVSQQQQKFMGMVHAMQKGEKVKGASPELKKVAGTMKKSDVKDFAKTKHAGLPKKVGEQQVNEIDVDALNQFTSHAVNTLGHGGAGAAAAATGAAIGGAVAGAGKKAIDWYYKKKEEKREKQRQKQQGMAEDSDEQDPVAAFLARGGSIQRGKLHKPRKSEKWQGSSHIGAAGGKGTKGSVSGLGANTSPRGNKPVVTADIHTESAVMKGVRQVTEARFMAEGGMTIGHIINRFKHEVKVFVEDGELDTDLYHALFDYYMDNGQMPYGVAKGRTGDPYEWTSEHFYRDLQDEGLVEAADPLEIPAYQRKHSARLGNFPAAAAPVLDAPNKIRPEEIPATQRKATGRDFPVSMDQVRDTSDKISSLDTLRKMAGLPTRT